MTDPDLIRLFSANGIVNLAQLIDDELRRVLWLGASGQLYLPQTLGNDIDAEIRHRNMRSQGYCVDCYEPFESCECKAHWS